MSQPYQLAIDQRVKVSAYDLPQDTEYTGTIRGFSHGALGVQVELDQPLTEAHTCDGKVPSGKGWNCRVDEVTPIDEVN